MVCFLLSPIPDHSPAPHLVPVQPPKPLTKPVNVYNMMIAHDRTLIPITMHTNATQWAPPHHVKSKHKEKTAVHKHKGPITINKWECQQENRKM